MLYPLFISIWFIHLGAFHRSVVKSEKTAICLSLELGNLKRLAVALNKISNVIWTKFRLKCNLETRIFKHVYHIKITLQDHTRLQKEHIMRITQIIQNHAKPHEHCETCATTTNHTQPRKTMLNHRNPHKTTRNHMEPCQTMQNIVKPLITTIANT